MYRRQPDSSWSHLVYIIPVRHPAYSGSILSLFGAALAFRNIAAVCLVPFCSLICYSTRIRVEEKALEAQFGKEYADYKRSTYRLFPYIF